MEYFNIYNKYGEKTSEIVERKVAHKNGMFDICCNYLNDKEYKRKRIREYLFF